MESCRDYIIADNRIRIYGPKADIAAAGVKSFEPFAADYDASKKPIVEIYTGQKIRAGELESNTLTEFDFEEVQRLHNCR